MQIVMEQKDLFGVIDLTIQEVSGEEWVASIPSAHAVNKIKWYLLNGQPALARKTIDDFKLKEVYEYEG